MLVLPWAEIQVFFVFPSKDIHCVTFFQNQLLAYSELSWVRQGVEKIPCINLSRSRIFTIDLRRQQTMESSWIELHDRIVRLNWIYCIFLKNVYLEAASLLWLVLIDHLHPWEEIAFLRTWSFPSPRHHQPGPNISEAMWGLCALKRLPQNVLFSNTHDFIILHATDFLFQICQFIFNASTNIPYWFWWFSLLAWKLLTI